LIKFTKPVLTVWYLESVQNRHKFYSHKSRSKLTTEHNVVSKTKFIKKQSFKIF